MDLNVIFMTLGVNLIQESHNSRVSLTNTKMSYNWVNLIEILLKIGVIVAKTGPQLTVWALTIIVCLKRFLTV